MDIINRYILDITWWGEFLTYLINGVLSKLRRKIWLVKIFQALTEESGMQTARVLVDFSYFLAVVPQVCGIISLRHPWGADEDLALVICDVHNVSLVLKLYSIHFIIEYHGVFFQTLVVSECSGTPTGAQIVPRIMLVIHVLYNSS